MDSGLSRVLFIGIHVKPSTADHEIEKLVDVYDEMKVLYDYEDAIIMGDLNADCGYWSNKDEANSLLTKDGRFTIHIDKQQDTTVSNSDCAYDRIITVGKTTGAVSNAAVFKYDAEYKMSQEEALDVSDHYPVEIQLD